MTLTTEQIEMIEKGNWNSPLDVLHPKELRALCAEVLALRKVVEAADAVAAAIPKATLQYELAEAEPCVCAEIIDERTCAHCDLVISAANDLNKVLAAYRTAKDTANAKG